ncbi:MAG: response regulator [Bacteroidetes bacterium]|nr:response regulator [Bacteroidota bacterium]
MSRNGPTILVDDDSDDLELITQALKELQLKNTIKSFVNSLDAFDYLCKAAENPFIILCDLNMPLQNGLEFKEQIDLDPKLREKSIPFIFYSTSVDPYAVTTAYRLLTIQGYFQKGSLFSEIVDDLKVITEYWKKCRHPNSK